MAGLAYLRRHTVEWNALTTVYTVNASHGRAVYRFLRDECDASFIQFIPIVERTTPETSDLANAGWGPRAGRRPLYLQEGSAVTERSVTPEGFGRFLIDVFEEWVRRDVGRVYVQMFDVALANWHGEPPSLCVHSKTCGNALALEHTGDVYSCDHFVKPNHLLGNISDKSLLTLVNPPQQRRFGQDKHDSLPRYCRECDVRFACHGGCRRTDSLKRTTESLGSTTCAPASRRSSATSTGRCASCPPARPGPGATRRHGCLRRRRRAARPQRPVHLRQRPKMEALSRHQHRGRQHTTDQNLIPALSRHG